MMSDINTKCKNSTEFVELVGLKIMQIHSHRDPQTNILKGDIDMRKLTQIDD